MRADSGLTVLAVILISATSYGSGDHEMDYGSEERGTGCEIVELTTINYQDPPLADTTTTLSDVTKSPTASVRKTTPQTERPKRPLVYRGESLVVYMPKRGKESQQNSNSKVLTETLRRDLNSLKIALEQGKIRARVIHSRPLQPVKSVSKPNQSNDNTAQEQTSMRVMKANPASGIPMPRNGELNLANWLQSLQNWYAGQAGNQGPSPNRPPQSGSNQNNFPQGGSPQSGPNQNNFPQGGYPQSGSNQNNFPQGGSPQSGPNQNNFPQGGSPQSGSNQNNFPQGGSPQSGSNQNNFPQGGSPQSGPNQNNFPQGGSPQSGSNQNNFPQGGSPQSGPNQYNFPQRRIPLSLKSLSTHDESSSGTVKTKKIIPWPMKGFRSKPPIKGRPYSRMYG
ncbi:basic salivary proline-rich protein 1-like [Sardina pilchardus]|uniref:basic salivary proline-rich protein 1-like n=1 Tax=Sardina pilchardus TaxID=27697 RepID=UPI002E0F7572